MGNLGREVGDLQAIVESLDDQVHSGAQEPTASVQGVLVGLTMGLICWGVLALIWWML